MSAQKAAGFDIDGALNDLVSIAEKYRGMSGSTIPILQDAQEAFGYIPEEAVEWLAENLDIPMSRFFGVVTFYAQFSLVPRGKNIFTVCCGTACHVKGSEKISDALRRELKLEDGQNTTEDLEFTVEKANCVGACSIAPVVIVNKDVKGKTAANKMLRQVRTLLKEGT